MPSLPVAGTGAFEIRVQKPVIALDRQSRFSLRVRGFAGRQGFLVKIVNKHFQIGKPGFARAVAHRKPHCGVGCALRNGVLIAIGSPILGSLNLGDGGRPVAHPGSGSVIKNHRDAGHFPIVGALDHVFAFHPAGNFHRRRRRLGQFDFLRVLGPGGTIVFEISRRFVISPRLGRSVAVPSAWGFEITVHQPVQISRAPGCGNRKTAQNGGQN